MGSERTPYRRGESRLFVDVHAHEPGSLAPLRGEAFEVRRDRVAWLAPRRPEVDDDGNGRCQHLGLERRGADLLHVYSLPTRARSRSNGTFHIASATIEPVIFEAPARRSTNVIGTSWIRRPARFTR